MIMDHVLGNSDRHDGNGLIHSKGHVMSIDNDGAFVNPGLMVGEDWLPWYMRGREEQQLHPDAAAWVKGLDSKALAGKMLDQGHEPSVIRRSIAALKSYQKLADHDMSIGQMRQWASDMVNRSDAQELARRGKKKVA